jgi:DNA-binding HxlR family transcriptional regulator
VSSMRSYGQYCGLALALDLVGDRWTLLIVRELLTGAKRFRDLQAGLPGIATNLLSGRLRAMEDNHLVERRDLPPPASATAYSLTTLGTELAAPVHALVRWGGHFMHHRGQKQEFRPHWLGVALQALGLRVDSSAEPLVVQIDLPEGSLLLDMSNAGVELSTSTSRKPDVRLRGAATSILGLAAGELDWSAAVRDGLAVDGSRAAIRVLRASLTKTRSARRDRLAERSHS